MRDRAAAKLAQAREIFQPHDPIPGWGTHIEVVCDAICQLIRHCADRETCTSVFTRWQDVCREVMSPHQCDSWHLLIQYGVQELLCFLHGCLADLIQKGENEKAVEVLVRRMLCSPTDNHG